MARIRQTKRLNLDPPDVGPMTALELIEPHESPERRDHRELVCETAVLTSRIKRYLHGPAALGDPDPGGKLADAIIGLLTESWRGLTRGNAR